MIHKQGNHLEETDEEREKVYLAAANPVIGYVSFRMRQKTADGPDGTDASGGWKRQQTDGN